MLDYAETRTISQGGTNNLYGLIQHVDVFIYTSYRHHVVLDCSGTIIVSSSCWLVEQDDIRVRKPVEAGNGVVVGARVRHDRAVRVRSVAVSVSMGIFGLCVGIVAVVVAPVKTIQRVWRFGRTNLETSCWQTSSAFKVHSHTTHNERVAMSSVCASKICGAI